MTPNGKNLKKLAEVPFFEDFSQEQLQWVDEHTDEFGFNADEEIPTDGLMESAYWVLLYGSWDIKMNTDGQNVHAVNDIGKWFRKNSLTSPEELKELTISSHSYVLLVPEDKMEEMLRMDYPILDKLSQGEKEHANY